LTPDYFEPLDKRRLYLFADRFGLREKVEDYFKNISIDSQNKNHFNL